MHKIPIPKAEVELTVEYLADNITYIEQGPYYTLSIKMYCEIPNAKIKMPDGSAITIHKLILTSLQGKMVPIPHEDGTMQLFIREKEEEVKPDHIL